MTNANGAEILDLTQAVGRFVTDGCHLSIGGFTLNRKPMAAVYEIIRQKIRGLHLYAHSNGQGVDELIGGGCVSHLEIAYAGTGRFAPTCIRFKKAVQDGALRVEDYSNYQMTLRFTAGAMGVPFLPTAPGWRPTSPGNGGFPKPSTGKPSGSGPQAAHHRQPLRRLGRREAGGPGAGRDPRTSPFCTFSRPTPRATSGSPASPSPMSSRPRPRGT